MKTFSSTNKAHAFGALAGRAWRQWRLQEQRLLNWLGFNGFNTVAANALLWTAKLIIIVTLFYAIFWLALLLLFAGVAANVIQKNNRDDENPNSEWRNGDSGYGLYTSDGYRIDPHDPQDELQ